MSTEVKNIQRIKKLDDVVANQIAAGEVIERPANVIKELIENSLDAGADNIKIEIKNFGSEYIKIRDNGKGIYKEDLPLAISAHATSKISTIEDLNNLYSFGFRGEALSSVASVSNFTLISKSIDSEKAYQISNDLKILESSHNQGTSIIVENLFYNTPARKKFLKSAKTETQHITDIINRVTLSNFKAGFNYIVDDKQIYRFNIADNIDLKNLRIKKILGSQFLENSKYFEDNKDSVKVSGWLGNSFNHYGSTDKQYVFLNNRIVKDKLLSSAIKSIYEDKIPKGRYPGYVIFIEIEPNIVDVNVHPSKYEVRFQNSYYIYSVIRQKLVTVLEELDLDKNQKNFGQADLIQNQNISKDIFEDISENKITINDKKYNYRALDNLNKNYSSTKFKNNTTPQFKKKLSKDKVEKPFFGDILDTIDNNYVLTKNNETNKFYIFNIPNAYASYIFLTINHKLDNNIKFNNFELIVPYKSSIDNIEISKDMVSLIKRLGFDFSIDNNTFKLTKIPDEFKYAELNEIGDILLNYLSNNERFSLIRALSSISYGRLIKDFGLKDKYELLDELSKNILKKECVFKSFLELNKDNIMKLLVS